MKEGIKITIDTRDELFFAPVNEEVRKEHLEQILDVASLKELTLGQRKREASKPIYLTRYE